jgi:hypothetical protein
MLSKALLGYLVWPQLAYKCHYLAFVSSDIGFKRESGFVQVYIYVDYLQSFDLGRPSMLCTVDCSRFEANFRRVHTKKGASEHQTLWKISYQLSQLGLNQMS